MQDLKLQRYPSIRIDWSVDDRVADLVKDDAAKSKHLLRGVDRGHTTTVAGTNTAIIAIAFI